MARMSWKEIVLGAIACVSLLTSTAMAQAHSFTESPMVRLDNRGPGSLNTEDQYHRGTMVIAQATEGMRQEDRRMDRRDDRRGDRQLDRRENRQADRIEGGRDNTRSNAGGELRGLDRADFVAGEHGQEGRDNARAAQMDRPNRPERMEQPQRPERPDRPERAGRH